MKQKKVHKLEGNHNLQFALIAISCFEGILKIAWKLNKQLNIDLRESEILIESKENPEVTFPVFSDREPFGELFFSLISNKSASYYLVKELSNIDFILEISGDIKKADIVSIIKELKKIEGINAALEVDPDKIKRKIAFCPK